jgi:hypothetical protein
MLRESSNVIVSYSFTGIIRSFHHVTCNAADADFNVPGAHCKIVSDRCIQNLPVMKGQKSQAVCVRSALGSQKLSGDLLFCLIVQLVLNA